MAAGAFQRPRVPAFATELDPAIRQLHSSDYRNPSQLADGPVLVVGLSHSGADLAHEIAATHPVIVSGKSHGQIPVPLESRRGHSGLCGVPGVHVARRDARHADRPQDGARGQEGRRSPPPLAQARAEGRRCRAHGRPDDWRRRRQAGARRRPRARRRERPVVHRLLERLQLDPPPDQGRRGMAGRCSTAA